MRRPVLLPHVLVLVVALAVAVTVLGAQRGAAPNLTAAEPMGPVENLTAYPGPPDVYNIVREDIPHGEVKLVEYDSRTLGIRRPLWIYTPPGYRPPDGIRCSTCSTGSGNTSIEMDAAGAGADHRRQPNRGWKDGPDDDRLPCGNATATPTDEKQGDRTQASYGQPYHEDLLKEVIPFVEANYSVSRDRANRGIGGMSMGAGQALNIGFSNLDKFDWIAVVAPAPDTRPPAELFTDPAALNRLKLLWLSVGNRDFLYRVAQGVHYLATEKGVNHIWRVDTKAHDTGAMSSNFYHFAQKLFK